jgi:hypothetical protein
MVSYMYLYDALYLFYERHSWHVCMWWSFSAFVDVVVFKVSRFKVSSDLQGLRLLYLIYYVDFVWGVSKNAMG